MSLTQTMMEVLLQYKQVFIFLAWGSLVLFLISLSIVPILIAKIPADYFHAEYRNSTLPEKPRRVSTVIFIILKNIIGFILIVLGTLMLALPGQGILTIIIGLFLMDFPGKYKFERKLVSNSRVLNSLNWIRSKANKPPLIL